ncbi:hypothetical protein V492_06339 [Pseudogymnoascus sp. VKM F-4246]|nr:hypothetical protein V492_06339 [Pseudogymnoascus sp. VKM F-4246]
MVRLQARQQQEVSRWPSHLERGESSSMGATRERSEDNVGLDALAAAVEHEEGAKSQSPERSQEGTPGPARV